MEKVLGLELRKLSNLICRYFEQQTNKQKVDAITGTNGWIIGYMARKEKEGKDVYQRDLERRFGITRSTASKVVSLMVQKGLIEQQTVENDRRVRRLKLTDKAQIIKDMMEEDHQDFENTLCKGFSGEEMEQLYSYLNRLQNNLSEMDNKEGEKE